MSLFGHSCPEVTIRVLDSLQRLGGTPVCADGTDAPSHDQRAAVRVVLDEPTAKRGSSQGIERGAEGANRGTG